MHLTHSWRSAAIVERCRVSARENVAAIPLKRTFSVQTRTNGILTRGEGEILNPVLIPPPPGAEPFTPQGSSLEKK